MKVGISTNEYGTLVSVHKCDTCGHEFSLCPAVANDRAGWENCLSVECPSYDITRDIDLAWGIDAAGGAEIYVEELHRA